MNEEWRPVVGFEGQYEVSDAGRVRRVARTIMRSTGSPYRTKEQLLAQVGSGRAGRYRGVGFKVARKTNRVFLVHRLVAQAFIPNPDDLPEVNHKDLDKTNNVKANLEWVTGAGNQQHAAALGRFHGRTNPNARFKLQPEQVDEILQQLSTGAMQKDLAAIYGVSPSMISMIKLGQTWVNPS